MVQQISKTVCLFVVWTTIVAVRCAWAQPTVRFPQTTPTAYPGVAPSTLGAPAFDPYAPPGSVAAYAPSTTGAVLPPGTPPAGSGLTPPTVTVPGTPAAPPGSLPPGVMPYGAAPGAAPVGTYPPGSAVPGTYPPGMVTPTTPPSLFPNGINTTTWGGPAIRFITPRVRYTFVSGGDSNDDLSINDFDFSAAMAFPNFLFSTQPLYVVPSFSLHLWSGPQPPVGELPANAYSAFLDFGWATNPAQPIGGEIGVRMGAFSGFDTFNTNSWRIMGQGLFRAQMTPTLAFRGGVIYLNRNKIKLLPAFGLLWIPNTQTRFDIFFPRPRLAQRLTTLGSQDLWWYLGGEYGGGSWTVKANGGMTERTDINDIRLILGLEWGQPALLQQGRRTGFVEFGWVTAREIVYVETPHIKPSIADGFMLRAGFNY